jgi:hypothetical protein
VETENDAVQSENADGQHVNLDDFRGDRGRENVREVRFSRKEFGGRAEVKI